MRDEFKMSEEVNAPQTSDAVHGLGKVNGDKGPFSARPVNKGGDANTKARETPRAI